jgi:asparaginyl-tRNA synthetase
MKLNPDGKTVRAMDILVPGVGEIIGGSQREDDLSKLEKRMDELNMSKDPLWWYLDLRRFGSVPHAGFGLGFERAIMYITGMNNIRDVIPFPRTPKNCDF